MELDQGSGSRSHLGTGRLSRLWRHGDLASGVLLRLSALAVILLVACIGYELWIHSADSRRAFGLQFLATGQWDPALKKVFGALPFIQGTLVTSLVALAVALPLGLGTAIFLAEMAPSWLSQPVGFLVEMLAAVPSVIYGLWGLFAFIPVFIRPLALGLREGLGFLPIFAGPVFGPSRLAAALVLTIMILPTLAAVSRDVFRAIPSAQREAALALGATHWEMILQVLLPYGLSGFLGAAVIALGRALGETMAVTMVIGNTLDLSPSLLHPGYTMASLIANEFMEATGSLYLSAVIEIGLVLFFITLILNFLARLLIWRVSQRATGEVRA